MPKITQNFRLFTALKSGEPVTMETLQNELGISLNSIPVYIHDLKIMFKADIESIREGKKVVAYKLLNADKIKVPEYRINNAQVAKKSSTPLEKLPRYKSYKAGEGQPNSVAVLDNQDDNILATKEDMELDTREMDDMKESLGLNAAGYDSDFSNKSRSDW